MSTLLLDVWRGEGRGSVGPGITSPFGSNAAAVLSLACTTPEQFGDRRSHNRTDMSRDAESTMSLTGDSPSDVTLRREREQGICKQRKCWDGSCNLWE